MSRNLLMITRCRDTRTGTFPVADGYENRPCDCHPETRCSDRLSLLARQGADVRECHANEPGHPGDEPYHEE